jgi:hypothetical protein
MQFMFAADCTNARRQPVRRAVGGTAESAQGAVKA